MSRLPAAFEFVTKRVNHLIRVPQPHPWSWEMLIQQHDREGGTDKLSILQLHTIASLRYLF
jgi:hypothetical protein